MRMRRPVNRCATHATCGALLLGMLVLLSLPAVDARARNLTLLSPEPGVPVTLFGGQSARGLTPFSVPNGEDYTLLATGGRGFEWRRARLRWTPQGNPEVINNHRQRALLGMVLPGAGSVLSGRQLYGSAEFLSASYLLTEYFLAADDASSRSDELEDWERLIMLAEDNDTEAFYRAEADLARALLAEEEDFERRQALLASGYLGLVALESWWFNRPLSTQTRGQQLRVQVPRISRGRAALASMLIPGMGQAYRGQRRAGLYLALWSFLVQEVHDNYLRKSIKAIRYEKRGEQWAADGLDPTEIDELIHLRLEFREAEDDLRIFTALAGALWFTNVLDVLISRPEGNRPAGSSTGLALTPSPAGRVGLAWYARF